MDKSLLEKDITVVVKTGGKSPFGWKSPGVNVGLQRSKKSPDNRNEKQKKYCYYGKID